MRPARCGAHPSPARSAHRTRPACRETYPPAARLTRGTSPPADARAVKSVADARSYTEKSATYVNTEGRVQRTSKAVDPPGMARDDWQIVVALSQVLGKPLPYESLPALRARMADIAPFLAASDGFAVEPSSAELAGAALDFVEPSAGEPAATPMVSSVTNFYMSDPVSKASATMAKCVQAFGTRA
eukprot:6604220-Prymnesium_polylepis.1